ncbi:MAG: Gfo/Idh/MocA family oxidoreductase [Candidatus Tectomicrobia bacterium]|uniref:Gfo/Idh/MocA family oxidoreductase n=1 Tax=Tectimicrobiota bacterium TaxID=2528274 RepID=A0A932GMJ9_UNCTE|nr:Gfo/Idh/MocA family oxidoreductase [Candidatus Tectomicrobia bacterium]
MGVAVVGAGYWGKNLVRNFAALGKLSAVCESDPQRLKSFENVAPGVRLVAGYQEILADPAIPAVAIATRAEQHYEMARQALVAGKDVFVEKPLSLKVAEGRALVDLAKEKGLILMVGHVLRYHPAVLKLKEMVSRGDLGKIQYVYSNRLNLGRFRNEENILWSFAPHDIAVILYLLGEVPVAVSANGGNYLHRDIADVTVTTMSFKSGVRAHIFVSWLHPYKEQKLVLVGDRQMAVFDDVAPREKLLLFNHKIEWVDRIPVPRREDAQIVPVEEAEPLRAECEHFLGCVETRSRPLTDGESGLQVLEVLAAAQSSLEGKNQIVALEKAPEQPYFAHPTAVIDEPCEIGEGTRIWHFSHVMSGAKIGRNCSIGQNVFIGKNVVVGNNVKIQNDVSVFEEVTLEDDVFCGPSMVFTNVINPRSHVSRKDEYRKTLVRRGATIGANATIVCGHTVGKSAFIGAGAVVTKDVPDYALVLGNPGRIQGWMCQCGVKMAGNSEPRAKGKTKKPSPAGTVLSCSACGERYRMKGEKVEPIPSARVKK